MLDTKLVALDDFEYEIHSVKDFMTTESGWELKLENGLGLCGTENVDDVVVAPGDALRVYGKGFGYRARGVEVIDKGFLYYRSVSDDVKRHLELVANWAAENQAKLDFTRSDRDMRWKRLSFPFQQRRIRFEMNNPLWRRDLEAYELMVCEDAARIGAHFESREELMAWRDLPENERIAIFAYADGHSGNSFECVIHFAAMVIADDDIEIATEHGALCPLLGCLGYGCKRKDA